jgi:hypothetical protein
MLPDGDILLVSSVCDGSEGKESAHGADYDEISSCRSLFRAIPQTNDREETLHDRFELRLR